MQPQKQEEKKKSKAPKYQNNRAGKHLVKIVSINGFVRRKKLPSIVNTDIK